MNTKYKTITHNVSDYKTKTIDSADFNDALLQEHYNGSHFDFWDDVSYIDNEMVITFHYNWDSGDVVVITIDNNKGVQTYDADTILDGDYSIGLRDGHN